MCAGWCRFHKKAIFGGARGGEEIDQKQKKLPVLYYAQSGGAWGGAEIAGKVRYRILLLMIKMVSHEVAQTVMQKSLHFFFESG